MKSNAELFNHRADTYQRVRPEYPLAVYDYVAAHKVLNQDSRVLEIGAGQGTATAEIAAYWQPYLDVVEPGQQLLTLLQAHLAGYNKLKLYPQRFEEVSLHEHYYDAVFSATAFHWLDKQTKYLKIQRLLKVDGLLVLYWHNFGLQDPQLERRLRTVYESYGLLKQGSCDNATYTRQKITRRQKEINASGVFELVQQAEIPQSLFYSKADYLDLLRTFPGHTAVKKAPVAELFTALATVLDEQLEVSVLVDLIIARPRTNSGFI